ncbi:beta-3-deoxy-D-manno-oct-2-ulosonic acid transferase [Sphingomonas sp. BAUL-RG-20F-R05-02]|uniref:capsular polysaccharide export protein, LipB/KpsS family n=1 Tax=Sphingomonas sp. BAUL-RG-20F-R05-02 TaxID=2914830 RepID=UPI001F56121C|nr:beta-3-deoxy-D-manno-oct-2-ulosonic acid transferase [Sphingomonas sp. BAUL-RG-20F-R05-02]
MDTPLLRAPPFPGVDATVSRAGDAPPAELVTPSAIDRLLDAICTARVGGCFWAAPATLGSATTIVHGSLAEAGSLLDGIDSATVLAVPRDNATDPWSLFRAGLTLIAHGDDPWVALAIIAGCEVRLLSVGRFGVPGADPAAQRGCVAADLLTTQYRDPYSGAAAGIDETIARLAQWRRLFEANRGIVAGCGFSWWKRREIARFLWTPTQRLRFFRSEASALGYARRQGGAVAVWPSRVSAAMVEQAAAQGVPLVRVEDGFVRSVGLGSNLVPPSSVTVDRRGIHYDPARESDLEHLLAHDDFSPELLARAAHLRDTIVRAGISKYASGGAHVFPERAPGKRLVLVPGQVEDDMSVRLGGAGLTSNLDLVRRARALEPDAEIWFRPHPDVDAGHRVGAVRDADALLHADRVVRGGGMAALLDIVDGVHVLTSLSGFEALLRGRDVTCHGVPFYAGWGLTRDLAAVPDRRGRALTLDALVAGVLIAYPRYLDPVTGLPCAPEILIRRMQDGAAHNRLGWVTRLKQVQGRLMKRRT